MSIKAVTWALEQEIDDPISQLLLINLADYADKDHKCFPGQSLLAKRLRRSIDTVQRHLSKLEKSGHITRELRADAHGHRTSNLYLLNVDVTVGVKTQHSELKRLPTPHQCGVDLNRKSASPKPQIVGCLNRTLHAVGTASIEPPTVKVGLVDRESNLTTVGASGDVASGSADNKYDSDRPVIRELAVLLNPEAPNPDQAERILSALTAYSDRVVRDAVAQIGVEIASG
jgi:hypothetical protein